MLWLEFLAQCEGTFYTVNFLVHFVTRYVNGKIKLIQYGTNISFWLNIMLHSNIMNVINERINIMQPNGSLVTWVTE